MARTSGSTSTTRSSASEGRTRCWRAMRVLRVFTIPQLCMTSDVSTSNARHYVKALTAAGYLRKVSENHSGRAGSFAVWHLMRDTGPKAPILRRDRRSIFDPNTKESPDDRTA